MRLYGTTKGKNGNTLSGVTVEIKDKNFHTLYKTQSDAQGMYSLDLPAGKYDFLTAVRDYADSYLEYWGQNISLAQDKELEIRIDTLEIYGLHVFSVKGAYPSLMIYFRPMSLEKYKNGNTDICPEMKRIRILIDGKEADLLEQNQVKEYVGNGTNMRAFLIQAVLPEEKKWDRVNVEIWDENNAYGMATFFAD